MRLQGKVALVTGSGSGLGRAIALEFAREGADIAVNAFHKETAEATTEAVKKLGRKAIAVPADAALTDEVDRMVDTVLDKFGKIDILVNNAGGGTKVFRLLEYPPEDWDRMVAINLRSTFLCSRKVGQFMAKQKSGKIVNMASVNAYGGAPFRAGYAPAKAGIVNLTMVMAVELGQYNINVNCLAPSVVMVNRIQRLADGGVFDVERVTKATPLGRLVKEEDVAKAALFLVSDESSAISGITIPVDGGWLAYRALV